MRLVQCLVSEPCPWAFKALLLVAVLQVPVNADGSLPVYMAGGGEHQVPSSVVRERFYCGEQVFGVVETSDLASGEYELHVRWIAPSGEQAETTRYRFLVSEEHEPVWAWLKLHRQKGAGVISWLDASAGMEQHIGSWQAHFELDGAEAGTARFDVVC